MKQEHSPTEPDMRTYFRPVPNTADLAELSAARELLCDGWTAVFDVADRLRDPDLIDPDTADHPRTVAGTRLAHLGHEIEAVVHAIALYEEAHE